MMDPKRYKKGSIISAGMWYEKFSVYWRGLRVWSLAQASCGINIHIYTCCLLPWTTQLGDGQWLQGYRFKNL